MRANVDWKIQKNRKFETKVLTALLLALASAQASAATATLGINATARGPQINPRMYGIFLEEINFGVDGGLYAELIRNRGFEDAKPPEGYTFRDGKWQDEKGYDARFSRFGYVTNGLPSWSLIKEGSCAGSMSLDLDQPLNEATPRSLRLEVATAGKGRIGIANEGFWAIGVGQGEKYNLSFWARCSDNFSGPLTVKLEGADGSACSDFKMIRGIGSKWKNFKGTLTGTRSEAKARFVIVAGSTGKVWFDMVSLFPARTFRNRPNGLRPDLAQMLAGLKPGFVRFPGGCVVEGGTIETAYNWKKTIGPLEQREEIWGPWNYRRTHGMGMLEYLEFCEDVGAEPLYVGFAGETCMFRQAEDVPMSEMGWVVTNFVDALEYANGTTATTWGKLRAAEGHPKPFDLKLVEVGNENGTRQFPERYHLVHSALKARFPDVQYIADLSFPRFMGGESFDMEDNHFYNSPQWFMNNVNHYDDRDRSRPPVYDGEVAVTSAEGGRDKGNMIAALGEGAFLMGLERNADVVRQVSYAPLLANVHGRTDWHGMIYFDSTRCFGTVSYYLWKLFAENRPTYTVQTQVELPVAPSKEITGAIGVGTWETSAEFKDVRVEKAGQVLFESDFAKGSEGWKTDGGDWSIVDGAYRQNNAATGLSFFGDETWSNYLLTLKARKIRGNEGFLICFARKNGERNWWNVGGWGNRENAIEFNQNSLGRHVPGSVETNRWYDIKIDLSDGRRIRCYLDGKLIHDEPVTMPNRFFSVAGVDDKTGRLIVKTINAGSEPITADLNLSNAESVDKTAQMIVLKSDRPADNNSLENPKRIVPVSSSLTIAGTSFAHEFPPNSLTILRIPMTETSAKNRASR
jgi:alpha-L-arabinofuranosidase